MKTKRRHELQTNVLAAWLAEKIEGVQPYSKAMLAVVIAAVAGYLAFTVSGWRSDREQAAGWTAFFDARSLDDLGRIAEDYPNSQAGLWALLSAADGELASGTDLLFRQREQAQESLESAVDKYLRVSQQATHPMLERRARFNIAQAYESLNNLDNAKEAYKVVVDTWPDSVLGKEAQRRLDDLNDPATEDFYTWFFESSPIIAQTPPVSASPQPTRSIYDDLPDDPDLSLPDLLDLTRPLPGGSSGPALPDPAAAVDEADDPNAKGDEGDSTDDDPASQPDDSAAPTDDASQDAPPSTSDDSATPEDDADDEPAATENDSPDSSDEPEE